MIRFALILVMSLALSSQAVAAVKWNNSTDDGKQEESTVTLITDEAKKFAQNFEFSAPMQVAVNTDKRLNYFKETGDKRCKANFMETSGFIPNVIDKIQAPMGYGLDDRFTIVSEFFRKSSKQCLGGVERACDDIHSYAHDFSTKSKIKKRKNASHFNDTLTMNMRLIGPMATALGVAWSMNEYDKTEKEQINDWLSKNSTIFYNGLRKEGFYKKSKDKINARKAAHNHATQSSIARMSVGVLSNDRDLFLEGVDQWFITIDSMREDGSLPIETRRGSRALFYQGRAISALFAIAHRAEVQGINLFDIEREKDIHRAVKFYLDASEDSKIVENYAKVNFAPGPSKNYKIQDLDGAGRINSSGQGWVRLYIDRYPNSPNTQRLLNLKRGQNNLIDALVSSVNQSGKSTEWITVDTNCFYTKKVSD